jgi:hypothetical protein
VLGAAGLALACGSLQPAPDDTTTASSADAASDAIDDLEMGDDAGLDAPSSDGCPSGWTCTNFDDDAGPWFGWTRGGTDASSSLVLVDAAFVSPPRSLGALSVAGEAFLERIVPSRDSLTITFELLMQKLPISDTIHPVEVVCDDAGVGTIVAAKVKSNGVFQVSSSNDVGVTTLPQPGGNQWRPARLVLSGITGGSGTAQMTMLDTSETASVSMKACTQALHLRIGALFSSPMDATLLLDDVNFGP